MQKSPPVPTPVLSPVQQDYVASLVPHATTVLRSAVRRVPSQLRDDAYGAAMLEWCRRMAAVTPGDQTAVDCALAYAGMHGRRAVSRASKRQADVLTVAIDVACYRQAIAAEPYLVSTATAE